LARTALERKGAKEQRRNKMKTEDRYLKFVRWNEEDALSVGYCPDLSLWGGVCHAAFEEEAYRQLGQLVREEIADLTRDHNPLPEPVTRLMREAVLA